MNINNMYSAFNQHNMGDGANPYSLIGGADRLKV